MADSTQLPKMPKKFGEQMTDHELQAVVQNQVRNATGYLGGQITEDRRKAMDRYLQNPLGNEVDGRSQVVASDVQDAVESVLPDLMGIFGSTDKLAEFEPVGSEDEDMADQASDYVNHIFYKDNEGFLILHDWIKDALLQINSITKTYWDERTTTETEEYEGLSDGDLDIILDSEGVEATKHKERVSEEAVKVLEDNNLDPKMKPDQLRALLEKEGNVSGIMEMLRDVAVVHDIEIKRTKVVRRVKVENIPPEEFLISRRALSLDSAPFTAHWTQMTVTELLEMGFDYDIIKGIPSDDEHEFNEERVTRFERDDEWPFQQTRNIDESMREVRVYEIWINIDYEGTKQAQLRHIIAAGPAYEILLNEPAAEHPFEAVTPIRMPHKFYGRSLTDLVTDIMLIKTAIWRMLLDNAYNINNARPIVSKKVEIEDVLNNRVGAPIRVDADSTAGHVDYMQTVPIGQHLYPLLEYTDTVSEKRTGISALSQGIDPNALDSTAGGINMLLGRAQRRILMMAQVMANMGVKRLAMKILRTAIRHQDKPRMVRIRGKWVDMDPRTWSVDMDVTVNVGLGTGTQENQQAGMIMLGQLQEKLVQLQQGVNGPFIHPHNIWNAASKLGETIGIKNIEPYISQVQEGQKLEQQNQPDPMAQLMAAELQQKGQIAEAEMQIKVQKGQADAQAAAQKQQLEHEKATADVMLDREKANAEIQLKREIAQAELNLKREMAGLDAQVNLAKIELDREAKAADLLLHEEMGHADRDMHERHHSDTMHASHEANESAKMAAAEPKKGNGKDKAPPPVVVNVGGSKKIDMIKDGDGAITGATVTDE